MTPPTADKDGEATGENAAVFAEWLSVSECAQRLDVTLPRLLRVLKRPEFAAQTEKQERQTKTGTRTVTLVNVSVLSGLKAVFNGVYDEQKRKRSHTEPLPFLADETTRAYIAAMMQQADARIAEQAATIADLRHDKDELRGHNQDLARRLESAEGEREHLRAKLLALPSVPTVQSDPREATDGDLRADVAETGQSADGVKSVPNTAQRGKWWKLWK